MTNEEAIEILLRPFNMKNVPQDILEAHRMAIEALKQEPCEDAISRQEVLDTLDNHKYFREFCEEHHIDWSVNLDMARIAINNLSSVTPKEKKGWIPVTEDAPQKGTICLWCNKQGRVFISAITYRSESSSYVGKHGYFSNGLENYGDIVAWMPLPKPYEPQESEDKEGK